MNFRLIRVFIYLFQFKLKIKYRFNKNHVIFDVLFRLFFDNDQIDNINVNSRNKLNLNTYHVNMINSFCSKQIKQKIYVINEIFIEMSNDFRKRILDDYAKKKLKIFFRHVTIIALTYTKKNDRKITIETIKSIVTKTIENNSNNVNEISDDISIFKQLRIGVDFELNLNDFIYNINIEIKRLCIFVVVKSKMYRLIHDNAVHVDIHRCYNRLTNIFYISRLFRKLKRYIKHCFNCQLNQIKRHRSYDELIFIKFSSYSFYIIVINLIFDLSNNLNVILIVIDKFSRRIFTISDKFIYDVN